MHRRTFLHTTLMTGLTLSVAPLVPRRERPGGGEPPADCAGRVPTPAVRGEPTPRQAWRLEQLAQAWRGAAAAGKPLLLIVVPSDSVERWCQSNAWGEAISHGPDSFIAVLDTAVLATATQAEIAAFLPTYTPQAPEPSMVRVDVCGLPATWEAARVEAIYAYGTDDTEALIDERITAIDAATRTLLPAGAGEVSDAARRAVIPGSRWGSAYGCGEDYETPDPLIPEPVWGVDCGMGHVSPRSQRFLDFLTREPPEPQDD